MENGKVIYLHKLSVDDIDEFADRIDRRIERILNISVEKGNYPKLLKGMNLLIFLWRQKARLFQLYSTHLIKQSLPKYPSGSASIEVSGQAFVGSETIEQLKRLRDGIV